MFRQNSPDPPLSICTCIPSFHTISLRECPHYAAPDPVKEMATRSQILLKTSESRSHKWTSTTSSPLISVASIGPSSGNGIKRPLVGLYLLLSSLMPENPN